MPTMRPSPAELIAVTPRPGYCCGLRTPSDDVRDAALALALARRVRTEARAGVAIAAVPGLFGCVAIAFGLLPPAYAPIASLLGCVMATVHARALEGKR